MEDIDADNSANDEGDEDVNIGADVMPPPPHPCPNPKRKAMNNQTANQVLNTVTNVNITQV